MNFNKIFFVFFILFCSAEPAYAYLDPGTGSIIIQSIVGGIAAAATIGTLYWSKMKSLVLRILNKETLNKDSDDK
jgi:hypothetical protein